MSFWGVGIGAAASIGGGLLSASGSKKSAQIAADANLTSARETNALNERLFNQSRGSDGHAILPNYFGGNEAVLGQSAYDNFQRLSSLGNGQFNQLQQTQAQLNPAFQNSLAALQNRYTGNDSAMRLGYLAPVQNARLQGAGNAASGYESMARANQGAIGTGLQRAIAQMNAQRAAQGYAGSSLFDRNRLALSTIGAQQASAQQMAGARFQGQQGLDAARFANAQETAGVNLSGLDFRSNPSSLMAALGTAGGFYGAPAQALSSSFGTAMSPLNYFRLNPQAFQAQGMPQQSPMLNNDQILGGALGQAGNTATNYFLNKQLLSQYGGGPQGGAGAPQQSSGGYNPYAASRAFGYGQEGFGANATGYDMYGPQNY